MKGMALMILMLGAEVALLVFIFLFVSWLRNSAAARRDRKAARVLIDKVKAEKNDKAAAVENYLQHQMGLGGDELKKAKNKIMRGQMKLMQEFASLYRTRDAAAAARFNLSMEQALEGYHELVGSGGGAATTSTDNEADDSELAVLRRENTRLSEELRVTMDTMSRMLSEYSTMFAGGEAAATVAATTPPGELPDQTAPLDDAVDELPGEETDVSLLADEAEDVADAVDDVAIADDIVDEIDIASDEVGEAVVTEPFEDRLPVDEVMDVDVSDDDIDETVAMSVDFDDVPDASEEAVDATASADDESGGSVAKETRAETLLDETIGLNDLDDLFDGEEVHDLSDATDSAQRGDASNGKDPKDIAI